MLPQNPIICRLIVDPPAPGAWNMAVDEALFEQAAKFGTPTLRFYQWSEPTLSLGYFQNYDDRRSHAASLGTAAVRRTTGGGAILHDQELTYSLVWPAGQAIRITAPHRIHPRAANKNPVRYHPPRTCLGYEGPQDEHRIPYRTFRPSAAMKPIRTHIV